MRLRRLLPCSPWGRGSSSLAVVGLCVVIGPAIAAAQSTSFAPPPSPEDDPDAERRFVWHPSVALTSLGYDTNVFNLPDEEAAATRPEQKGDFVASLAAGLAPVWRVGEAKLSAETGLVYNYFQHYEAERGFDGTLLGRVEVPVSRLRLWASSGYQNLRQRVNFEVDQRARRTERDAAGGVDVGLGQRATIGVRMRRALTRFDEDSPQSFTLRETLNRDERTGALAFTYALSPLTSLVASGERGVHKFVLSPLRDGNRTRLGGGVNFASDALIAGQATLGWQRVTVRHPLIPAFNGLTGVMNLSTVFGNATRFGVHGARDVTFSIEELAPYYVQNSLGASLMQALGEKWEVGVRFKRIWLNYVRSIIETTPAYRERIDVLGTRLGFRFPGGYRVSVEWEDMRRDTSGVPLRSYDSQRIYTVISKALVF